MNIFFFWFIVVILSFGIFGQRKMTQWKVVRNKKKNIQQQQVIREIHILCRCCSPIKKIDCIPKTIDISISQVCFLLLLLLLAAFISKKCIQLTTITTPRERERKKCLKNTFVTNNKKKKLNWKKTVAVGSNDQADESVKHFVSITYSCFFVFNRRIFGSFWFNWKESINTDHIFFFIIKYRTQ